MMTKWLKMLELWGKEFVFIGFFLRMAVVH